VNSRSAEDAAGRMNGIFRRAASRNFVIFERASIKGLGWKLMECASSEDCNDGWRRINNKILSAHAASLARSLALYGALNFLISSFDGGARELVQRRACLLDSSN
jgi:hypothetical protein